MSAQHTPGPWVFFQDDEDRFDDDQIIISNESRINSNMVPVAKVSVEFSEAFDAEQRANARLIAAAPELLEILKEADRLVIWEMNMAGDGFQERVEALISKAEGLPSLDKSVTP